MMIDPDKKWEWVRNSWGQWDEGIDDLVATGGTADAAAKLIKISNGKVAGFIFVINLFDIGGCNKLIKQGYKVENLINFPGH